MPVLALTLQESGSTVGKMLESIPRDASAFLVYILVIAFVAVIWIGSRKRNP